MLVFLLLSPTDGTKPGCGWLVFVLFLLLFDFHFLPLLRSILPYLIVIIIACFNSIIQLLILAIEGVPEV